MGGMRGVSSTASAPPLAPEGQTSRGNSAVPPGAGRRPCGSPGLESPPAPQPPCHGQAPGMAASPYARPRQAAPARLGRNPPRNPVCSISGVRVPRGTCQLHRNRGAILMLSHASEKRGGGLPVGLLHNGRWRVGECTRGGLYLGTSGSAQGDTKL